MEARMPEPVNFSNVLEAKVISSKKENTYQNKSQSNSKKKQNAYKSYNDVFNSHAEQRKKPQAKPSTVSFSFAAGVKIDLNKESGLSFKILNPEEIASEHKKAKKVLPHERKMYFSKAKGSLINLYC